VSSGVWTRSLQARPIFKSNARASLATALPRGRLHPAGRLRACAALTVSRDSVTPVTPTRPQSRRNQAANAVARSLLRLRNDQDRDPAGEVNHAAQLAKTSTGVGRQNFLLPGRQAV